MDILQVPPPVFFLKDSLQGSSVAEKTTTVKDLEGIFADESAREQMPENQTVYQVEAYMPVSEGTTGGLFFGVTKLQPGQVGEEYFMTRGHYHAMSDRGEFYWCIQGEGYVLFMSRDRKTSTEKMRPGSLHYIPGHTAHRVINTGAELLSFGACWPSDAGHNYEEIAKNGFAARIMNVNGKPQIVTDLP